MTSRKPRSVEAAIKEADIKVETPKEEATHDIKIDDIGEGPKEAKSKEPVKDTETVASVKAQLEKTAAELEKTRSRNSELEAARETTAQTAKVQAAEKWSSELGRVTEALGKINLEIEKLEKEAVEAFNNGENARGVKLNRQIAGLETDLKEQTRYKAWVEAQKTKAENLDDVEETTITKKSQEWINAHPEFETDTEYREKMLDKHYSLIRRGVKGDSDEYFRQLNAYSDTILKSGKKDDDVKVDSKEVKKDADEDEDVSFDGAPPSRDTGGDGTTIAKGRWLDSTTYRPSPEEIEAAEVCGFTKKDGSVDVAAYIKDKYPERFKKNS